MEIPANLLYTKEHEWALLEGGRVRMGITDYAQEHLGDVTYVEPPEKKEIKQFELLTTVESVKAASDIYAPLSGEIVEFNGALDANPELLNRSPYGEGWIAVLEIKDESETAKLMDSEGYSDYLKSLEEKK